MGYTGRHVWFFSGFVINRVSILAILVLVTNYKTGLKQGIDFGFKVGKIIDFGLE